MKTPRPAWILALSLASTAEVTAAPGPETSREIASFFETHCTDCHGPEKAKGDIRLHDLSADFSDAGVLETWQKVLEKLETGAMPPKKRPRPSADVVRKVTRWIRAGLEKENVRPAIEHKRRSPEFGNHLDHETLFDGSRKGPAFSPSRLWRVSPQVYDRFVKGLGGGLREATAIHQPFAVDENKGVIADYAEILPYYISCNLPARFLRLGCCRSSGDNSSQRPRHSL